MFGCGTDKRIAFESVCGGKKSSASAALFI